jgi:hypothetical protein
MPDIQVLLSRQLIVPIWRDPVFKMHTDERTEVEPQIRLGCRAGGIEMIPAAHLQSTVANRSTVTRYRIDFRAVELNKAVLLMRTTPRNDSAPTGGSLWQCPDERIGARPSGGGKDGRSGLSRRAR